MMFAMIFRAAVIVIVLFAADAYFAHGKYLRMAVETAQGFGNDFNYQVARLLRLLH